MKIQDMHRDIVRVDSRGGGDREKTPVGRLMGPNDVRVPFTTDDDHTSGSLSTAEGHHPKSLLINLISGGMAGFCVVLVGYPFDLLKTRLQTAPTRGTTEGLASFSDTRLSAPPQSGSRHGRLLFEVRRIWRTTGWRGFYQGASAPLLGVTPIFAINFYGYDLGKRLYGRLFAGHPADGSIEPNYSFGKDLPLSQYAFGAAFSAAQTALIVIPAERVKVFMQLPLPAHISLKHRNALQVGLLLWREGGLRALFRGTTSTLLRDVPGLMTFFTTYELLKQRLVHHEDGSITHMVRVMMSGGLAGIASWLVSLPSDVLKSRVQAAGKHEAAFRARFPTWFVLRELLQTEGPLALYRGIVPVLLRAFPANAACFLGYEITKLCLQNVL